MWRQERSPVSPVEFVALADLVDAGGGTPADRAIRRRILTFQVRPAAAGVASKNAAPAPAGGRLRGQR